MHARRYTIIAIVVPIDHSHKHYGPIESRDGVKRTQVDNLKKIWYMGYISTGQEPNIWYVNPNVMV